MCRKLLYCRSHKKSAIAFSLFVVGNVPATGAAAESSYTKISNSGRELSAQTKLGTGASDWACTRDEVTGLIWEIKAKRGLRSWRHTYCWYDPNPLSHGGFAGSVSGGSCHQPGRCDTEKYVQDVNAKGLCGHSDWRMPSREELMSLIKEGCTVPSIDTRFSLIPRPCFSGRDRRGRW